MMAKIALMFPGQGTQRVGMGRDLYNKYLKAREIIDIAGDELKNIIFNGPEEVLKLSKYVQPAIFTVSMAAFEVFKELYDISVNDFVVAAGHSLGEYSALCAAGFFSFRDGLAMVKARGEFIQKASEENPGTMAAIIGLKKSVVECICKQVSNFGVCEPVNFNSPEQIVVAGSLLSVNKAIKLATIAGATKCIILNVSGPFHSSLMTSAADDMSRELEKYIFNVPSFGVFTNCDALLTTDELSVKKKLIKQINNPVKWDDIISNIIAADFDVFVEIGSGRVLSGLLKRIDISKKVLNIEDSMSLQKTLLELNRYETSR
ncbi:MAG: ACP S-malonyltransferase [Endomicrobium sp.]|jgi:[acyl-carrier-protein] S-malonyltransferase|nr:ACP S-malonyltransferase [Endomicrobium sp.]